MSHENKESLFVSYQKLTIKMFLLNNSFPLKLRTAPLNLCYKCMICISEVVARSWSCRNMALRTRDWLVVLGSPNRDT